MSVTDEQKLDVIIAHLTDVIDGGYPGEILWIGDTLAYTSANTGEKYGSRLGAITRKAMLAWYDRAAALVEDDPSFEMSDALYETADGVALT
jgi:hypothetical protein